MFIRESTDTAFVFVESNTPNNFVDETNQRFFQTMAPVLNGCVDALLKLLEECKKPEVVEKLHCSISQLDKLRSSPPNVRSLSPEFLGTLFQLLEKISIDAKQAYTQQRQDYMKKMDDLFRTPE